MTKSSYSLKKGARTAVKFDINCESSVIERGVTLKRKLVKFRMESVFILSTFIIILEK